VEFLRHTPIIATNGPVGLNAAVKGVGFVVKEDILPKILSQIKDFAGTNPSRRKVLKFILENLYLEKTRFQEIIKFRISREAYLSELN